MKSIKVRSPRASSEVTRKVMQRNVGQETGPSGYFLNSDFMSKYTGSDFDDFLREEGILEEVTAGAHKRLLSLQLNEAMEASEISPVAS